LKWSLCMSAGDSEGTRLPPKGDPRTLYIVDVSGYVFRAYHALPPLMSPKGEPTHAVLGVTNMLRKLIVEQQPALLAVAMDSKGKSFRHGLYPEYKANRPPPPPDLSQQITRLREIMEASRLHIVQQEGVEADDLIASLVKRARQEGLRVVIVSADKDLLQLIDDDVVMYDTGRNVVFGAKETEAKLGVPPERVRDYLALVGDTSDNVPGVPSVGPKTAVQLLVDHGDLDGIYAHLDAIKKPALRDKLAQHRDQAYLSRKLVSLEDALPLPTAPRDLVVQAEDKPRLRVLFQELGFQRLAKEQGEDGSTPVATPAAIPTQEARACVIVTDDVALRKLDAQLLAATRVLMCCVLDAPRAVDAGLVGLLLAGEAGDWVAYVPVGHTYLGRPEQLDERRVLEVLRPRFADARLAKVCVDSKRDHIGLEERGVALAGVAMDLMLASYLVDAERHGHSLRELAAEISGTELGAAEALLGGKGQDTRASDIAVDEAAQHALTIAAAMSGANRDLGERLTTIACEKLLADVELPLAEVLAEMERTGIQVDVQHLHRMSSQVAEQLVLLEAKCKSLAGRDFNVASPRQLEAILFDELGLPVIKRTKTARSTDQDVLEELAAAHPLPAAILEHRMLAKLKSTYLDALPKQVHARSGRIHTDMRQAVAATGRLSSTDPNLQNIPIRSEIGRHIRDAFVPREGWELFCADYSQIELRVLAHLSHDEQLLAAYREGLDVHVRTARALFGVDEQGVTREMRAQAKTVNFAVIYGQTQFALARNLRIERAQAAKYISAFFEQYAGVKRYMDEVVEQARVDGFTRTLLGRVRKVPELSSKNRQIREAAERVARNTPIQGTAADIIKLAMVAVHKGLHEAGMQSKMLLSVHDELVFEAPVDEKAPLEALVRSRMERALALDVPLVVDVGWGKSWGASK
jgi:DNA polymerase I